MGNLNQKEKGRMRKKGKMRGKEKGREEKM